MKLSLFKIHRTKSIAVFCSPVASSVWKKILGFLSMLCVSTSGFFIVNVFYSE